MRPAFDHVSERQDDLEALGAFDARPRGSEVQVEEAEASGKAKRSRSSVPDTNRSARAETSRRLVGVDAHPPDGALDLAVREPIAPRIEPRSATWRPAEGRARGRARRREARSGRRSAPPRGGSCRARLQTPPGSRTGEPAGERPGGRAAPARAPSERSSRATRSETAFVSPRPAREATPCTLPARPATPDSSTIVEEGRGRRLSGKARATSGRTSAWPSSSRRFSATANANAADWTMRATRGSASRA